MKNMIKKLSRIKQGAYSGWNVQISSDKVRLYESGPGPYILNALGAMATGYLMRYDVLGYNIYFIYLAILLSICFFISHGYVSIDRWTVINILLKRKDLDLKNPELDKLVIRSARFAICAKWLILQVKPIWIILGLILGYNLMGYPRQVEKNIFDLIRGPLEELEKNNKYIKELTILTKGIKEGGITYDGMKINTIEIIKELDKQKADMVKSNCNLNGEIVDILKSNCIKKK